MLSSWLKETHNITLNQQSECQRIFEPRANEFLSHCANE